MTDGQRGLSPEEAAAGAIVAQALGGIVVPRDIEGAPEETHDLDVVEIPLLGRVALEVTSARDEAIKSLHSAGYGRKHLARTLASDWWVGLPNDGELQVRKTFAKAEPHVRVLEQHGVRDLGGVALADRRPPAGANEQVAAASRALFDLGVSYARRLSGPDRGEVPEFVPAFHGGAGSDFGTLYALVEACANDNAAKLIAAECEERHLFVWMGSSASDAELAFATLSPPAVPPRLPAGVDALWLASPTTTPGAAFARLWRLRPPGGWENLTPWPASG